jgi:putative methyltransferase (TIGR04325 family)
MSFRRTLARARGFCDVLLHRAGLRKARFRGAFSSRDLALAAIRPDRLAGYDHDQVAAISFDKMCQIQLWDWPVMYWLLRLEPQIGSLLDAGGHMGTKYRAFRNHVNLEQRIQWIIYDLPAIVRAGRERATKDGLFGLSFIDNLDDAQEVDVLLASGLLQYLDIPLGELLRQLPAPPKHLLLNKVAIRNGPSIVTLENFGCAEVPYQIRNRDEFLSSLEELGYEIVDAWEIPELSHVISTHPRHGKSISCGYYARLRGGENQRECPAPSERSG